MGMNLQVALGWRRHLLLHASAVAKDGRALIMSGESGSGKSTLAALLGEGDWRLMGDEFTLIDPRSEEHTSELQSLMRISYAVFCLKKKKKQSTVTLRFSLL